MFDGGLPHDAMHDILEGIVPLEMNLYSLTVSQMVPSLEKIIIVGS